MGESPKKKLRWAKRLVLALGLMAVGGVFLYQFIQSPAFLRFVFRQLNNSISGQISYDTFALDLNRRNLTIRGLVYQNTRGQKIVSLNSLDLDFAFSSALRGNLGIQHLRGEGLLIDQRNLEKQAAPSSWRTALRLILKRLSAKDSSLENISLFLRNGDEFHFDRAKVDLSTQVATKQEVHLEVDGAILEPAGQKIKAGHLAFGGKIKVPVLRDFTFFVDEAEGQLNLENVQVGSLPASSFTSDFKIGGDTLYLINGRFIHPDGSLSVDVDYIPSKSTYKVDLKTIAPFPFSSIPHIGKEVTETFDKFEFALHAELQGYKLDQMTGKVGLEFKAIGDTADPLTPENKMHLLGDMKQGVLELKEFKLASAKSEVNGSGKIDFPKQRFDVKINTKGFDLATMIQALSDLDLRGFADAEGTIQGPFKKPDFVFKATGHDIAYSFLHFGENTGTFKIVDGNLSYEGGAPAGSGFSANVQVHSADIFHKTRHTVLKTQFQNLEAAKVLDNPDIQGKISGSFDLDAVGQTPATGVLKAQIPDFNLYTFKLGPIDAEGKLGNRKFTIYPMSFQPPNFDKIAVPSETVFDFDDKGVKVHGQVLPGFGFTGNYTYAGPKKFFIDADAKNVDMRPIWAALELPAVETRADGKVKLGLGIKGTPSEIDILATRFDIPLEGGGAVTAAEPIHILIKPPRMTFERARFRSGGGTLSLDGSYQFDGPMNLHLEGRADLGILEYWKQFFRDAEGFANVDLRLGGTRKAPQILGGIDFNDATVSLRAVRGTIESLSGKIRHNGKSLLFENLSGNMSEGDITVNGRIDMDGFHPKYADLKIDTREVAIAEPEVYKIVFSGDFGLKGPADDMLLSGNMFITEGRYIRNFNISQFILKPQAKTLPEEPNPWLGRIRLDLGIKSPGELSIKNNVAKMFLASDLKVTGPALQPNVQGTIQVLDGEFNYFKIAFGNARGYVDFRGPKVQPYVDVTASKEVIRNIGSVTVTTRILGYLDNLRLDFQSDAGLPKGDILAMVFTGAVPGQAGFSSSQLASTVIASQIAGFLERPLAEKASLDIFRLEAVDETQSRRPDRQGVTQLVVGKHLTERLSLEFKTDLGVSDPLQGVQAEYLLLDNALLKASQLSDGSFDLNFTLRWRSF